MSRDDTLSGRAHISVPSVGRAARGGNRSGEGGESRAGASPELVVPATALRRCEEGWGELLLLLLLLHRGTGGGGASKRRRRDAVQA